MSNEIAQLCTSRMPTVLSQPIKSCIVFVEIYLWHESPLPCTDIPSIYDKLSYVSQGGVLEKETQTKKTDPSLGTAKSACLAGAWTWARQKLSSENFSLKLWIINFHFSFSRCRQPKAGNKLSGGFLLNNPPLPKTSLFHFWSCI